MPPPTLRQAPVSAGSEVMARTAWPPVACRSTATPTRMAAGCVVAYSVASCSMSCAGTPVICATRSGG